MDKIIRGCIILIVLLSVCSCTGPRESNTSENKNPNIIYILADDLGYGDVHVLNNASKIPTPNMDRIANEGATFIDAHSGSAVCTPTRYGVITGRYAWRSKLKRGVLNGYSKHLIDPERTTVADLLNDAGYETACIGKWHLGMDMPLVENHQKTKFKLAANKTIQNGPNAYGFDYFYGISASLDFPPYVFMENDRFVGVTTDSLPQTSFPKFSRAGERDPNFSLDDSLDQITEKAVDYIKKNAEKPFFLYFPLTAPHKPVLPHKRFKGNTALGPYGDFVSQVDWTVGQILNALDEMKISENTLVILTSDNGSFMKRIGEDSKFPQGATGHVNDHKIQAFDPVNHRSNFEFRGTKADIYEGGHHIPFLVRWPEQLKASQIIEEPICLTDLFGTVSDILKIDHDRKLAGEDSFSFLPLIKNQTEYTREPVIHHSSGGTFAIRKNNWKLILNSGSGGRQHPRGKAFEKPYQLYDLTADGEEQNNVFENEPVIAKELMEDFNEIYGRTETMPELN
jgi:arylsulfatase A